MFNWVIPSGIADYQHRCEWRGFVLWSHPRGDWRVLEINPGGATLTRRIGHEEQVKGKDLKDAQRRAQAAAMVLHSLRDNSNTCRQAHQY